MSGLEQEALEALRDTMHYCRDNLDEGRSLPAASVAAASAILQHVRWQREFSDPDRSFIRLMGGQDKALAWLVANRERLVLQLSNPTGEHDGQVTEVKRDADAESRGEGEAQCRLSRPRGPRARGSHDDEARSVMAARWGTVAVSTGRMLRADEPTPALAPDPRGSSEPASEHIGGSPFAVTPPGSGAASGVSLDRIKAWWAQRTTMLEAIDNEIKLANLRLADLYEMRRTILNGSPVELDEQDPRTS